MMRNLFNLSTVQRNLVEPAAPVHTSPASKAVLLGPWQMLVPPHSFDSEPSHFGPSQSDRDAAPVSLPDSIRPRCLIVLAHPERGLSNTLLQHLQQELPRVELTLRDNGSFDCIWFCGYELESRERLVETRRRHPEAGLLVTARADGESWADSALSAGADRARDWPLSMPDLRDEIEMLMQAREHSRASRAS
jgi:hypothetical protein